MRALFLALICGGCSVLCEGERAPPDALPSDPNDVTPPARPLIRKVSTTAPARQVEGVADSDECYPSLGDGVPGTIALEIDLGEPAPVYEHPVWGYRFDVVQGQPPPGVNLDFTYTKPSLPWGEAGDDDATFDLSLRVRTIDPGGNESEWSEPVRVVHDEGRGCAAAGPGGVSLALLAVLAALRGSRPRATYAPCAR